MVRHLKYLTRLVDNKIKTDSAGRGEWLNFANITNSRIERILSDRKSDLANFNLLLVNLEQ